MNAIIITCPKCQSRYEAPWYDHTHAENYHCPVCYVGKSKEEAQIKEEKIDSRKLLKD